ncbi:hypothetical protein [Paraflavitalea soli]|nr:hypothetical protein [Paraflavitalea soli]
MRYVLLLLVVVGLGETGFAQIRVPIGKRKAADPVATTASEKAMLPRVGVPELIAMLEWTGKQIDTTLKKKGYLLMQKDVDSTSSLFLYSMLTKLEDGPTTVRSFSFMDAAVGELKSRMITYRTYDKNEFRDISSYLLANNYQKTNEFDFDEAKHSLYSNGTQEIRLKVITTVRDKRTFIAYELELGK